MIRIADHIINENRIVAAYPSPMGGTELIMDGANQSVLLDCELASLEDVLRAANLLAVGLGVDVIGLTNDELATLRMLHSDEFRYLARDGDGKLFAYKGEPEKGAFGWRVRGFPAEAPVRVREGFDFLTWSDDQPLCIIAALQAQEKI